MEETSFEKFFKENFTRLYYYAVQITGEREVSRDIVGEAFEETYAFSIATGNSNLLGYIYRLVRNKCIDHLRHESAKSRYADLYLYGHDDWDDLRQAEYIEESEHQIKIVYDSLDMLTPRTRQILELHYFRGLTYQATAQQLGISPSAVRKHIVAALKTLRQELSKKMR